MNYQLSKVRKAARELLTLDEKDPKRLFEGAALLRRLHRYGILEESKTKLDYVLSLTAKDFLERRLQTTVFKLGLARSIHHARVLIRQRHIRYVLLLSLSACPPSEHHLTRNRFSLLLSRRVGKQIVNVPSFLVRTDSQMHIDFALTSPFGGGRAGRVKRKKSKAPEAEGGEDEE